MIFFYFIYHNYYTIINNVLEKYLKMNSTNNTTQYIPFVPLKFGYHYVPANNFVGNINHTFYDLPTGGTPMDIDDNFNNKKEIIEISDDSDDSDYEPEETTKRTNKKKTTKTYRKKNIPHYVKKMVWEKYVGLAVGKQKCKFCNIQTIYQLSFTAGHVVAEVNGGDISVDNLRPICDSCNKSMGTKHMKRFYEKKSGNKTPFELLWKH